MVAIAGNVTVIKIVRQYLKFFDKSNNAVLIFRVGLFRIKINYANA